MFEISDRDNYMESSLKDFRPPTADKTVISYEDLLMSGRVIGGSKGAFIVKGVDGEEDELRFYEDI